MYSLLSRLTGGGGAMASATTTAAAASAGNSAHATAPTASAAAAAAAAASSASTSTPVQSAILARRAVFPKDMQRGARLPRAKLEKMLEAARWAPTHKLTQPWRFVVLQGDDGEGGGQSASSKQQFERLSIELVEKHTQDADKRDAVLKKLKRKQESDWRNVAAYIAIAMRRTQTASAPPEWEESASVAAAVQNMWLAGWEEGVHGYWSSWQPAARDAEEMKAFLGLEPADRVLGFFVCGVADPERLKGYRGSRKPLAEVVQWR
jgi:nitroreductase